MRHLSPTRTSKSTLLLEEYNRIQEETSGTGIKRIVAFGCLVVALFGGGSTYWAVTSRIDGAVVAPASLVVQGNRKTVEHLEGGIVRNILVSDGDFVEVGQTLLELDSTDLDVNLDVLTSQLGDLSARRARLLAQIGGSAVFDRAFVTSTLRIPLDQDVWIPAFETQKRLFDAESRTLATEHALQEQQIEGLRQQISGLVEQRTSNRRQLEITGQELANLETLLAKGLVAAVRVNTRRVEIERLNGVDAALRTQEAQASNQISELKLTGLGQQKLRAETLANELALVEAQLATLEPQYAGAVERRARIAVKAPVSGRVVGLTVFTNGGVVRPGAAILDIVPRNDPLVVEARVNTDDIEKLYIGQLTRIRLSAFDQGEVPEALGSIVDISADTLEDARTGQPYYTARVAFDDVQPREVADLDLLPGMPADLFVNTGERTAVSYFTQPLQTRLARTFID